MPFRGGVNCAARIEMHPMHANCDPSCEAVAVHSIRGRMKETANGKSEIPSLPSPTVRTIAGGERNLRG